MTTQVDFGDMVYSGKKKVTRRERFLHEMEGIVPFGMFCDTIRPYYAVKGNGRPPIDLEVMVRMYLISQWYTLSDEACEDMIYENHAVRNFVGIELSTQDAPDATTLTRFRELLVRHNLTKRIFDELNRRFERQGMLLREGTIVDATIIHASSSTQNKDKKRDEQMSSTKKNNNYHFGMKAHIGVDKDSGIVHSVYATTAKVPDIEAVTQVLHGQESSVYGDSAYIGLEKRPDMMEKYGEQVEKSERQGKRGRHPAACVTANIDIQVNRKRQSIKTMPAGWKKDLLEADNRNKSSIRAKVEHPFRVIKQVFGFRRTRYRGIAKNESKLYMLFGLSNLYFAMLKNRKL